MVRGLGGDSVTLTYRIDGGASPFGFGYWSRYAICPRSATLDDMARQAGAEGEEPGDGLYVGICAHAYLDLHYSGQLDCALDEVELLPTPPDDIRNEAIRVATAHIAAFPADAVGRTLATELSFPADYATEGEQAERVARDLGVAPFTGRSDRVMELATQDEVDALIGLRPELVGIEPGRYVIDYKFLKQKNKNFRGEYQSGLRYPAYIMAHNAAYPDLAVNGLIVDCTFKYKTEVKFESVLVRAPDETTQQAVREFLVACRLFRDSMPTFANAHEHNCFPLTRDPCRWFTQGVCDRTTFTAPEVVRIGESHVGEE